jgi:hypothetical protein
MAGDILNLSTFLRVAKAPLGCQRQSGERVFQTEPVHPAGNLEEQVDQIY